MESVERLVFGDAFKGVSVFVTGHTGFKGAWLTEWLLHLGADVSGYSIGIPTSPSHFKLLELENRVRHFVGDIRDSKALKKALQNSRPQLVIHLAAQSLVRASYETPLTTLETNIMGTAQLLEILRDIDSTRAAVIVTSDKCYENREWEYGYRESDRLGGKDPYSASKACAEILVQSYAHSFLKQKIALATARAGNVIGGGDWSQDRIVPDCIRAWERQEPVAIRRPCSIRPWQHVLEPIGGYLLLALRLFYNPTSIHSESFNFGPAIKDQCSTLELVHALKADWGDSAHFQIVSNDLEPAETGTLRLNCDRAHEQLKWSPTLSLRENIRLTVGWYQNYFKNPAAVRTETLRQIIHFETIAQERQSLWLPKIT